MAALAYGSATNQCEHCRITNPFQDVVTGMNLHQSDQALLYVVLKYRQRCNMPDLNQRKWYWQVDPQNCFCNHCVNLNIQSPSSSMRSRKIYMVGLDDDMARTTKFLKVQR